MTEKALCTGRLTVPYANAPIVSCGVCGLEVAWDNPQTAAAYGKHTPKPVDTVKCPYCEGRGKTDALARYVDGQCRWTVIDCNRCGGSGTVTAERARMYEEGKAYRESRVAARVSLRERAEELGTTPEALSRFEHGLSPWPGPSEVTNG